MAPPSDNAHPSREWRMPLDAVACSAPSADGFFFGQRGGCEDALSVVPAQIRLMR